MVKKTESALYATIMALLLCAGLLAALLYVGVAHGQPPVGQVYISEVFWAGTTASSSDEAFELYNVSVDFIDTTGFKLLVFRSTDTEPTEIVVPPTVIPPGGIAIFERTDDTVFSNIVADGIYVGSLPNTDVVGMQLVAADGTVLHDVPMPDGWLAGTSTPRASMAAWFGVSITWYTSGGQYNGAVDADGWPVLGSPGDVNPHPEPNPDTCVNGWPLGIGPLSLRIDDPLHPIVRTTILAQDADGGGLNITVEWPHDYTLGTWYASIDDADYTMLSATCKAAVDDAALRIEVGLNTGIITTPTAAVDNWVVGFHYMLRNAAWHHTMLPMVSAQP